MCLSCEEGADELFSQRQILSLFFNESTSVQSQLKEPWDGVLDWSIDCGLLPDKNFSDSTLEEKWIMDFHPQRTDYIRVTLLPCLTEGLKFLSRVVMNLEWDHLAWGVSLCPCVEGYFFCDSSKCLGCKGKSVFLEREKNVKFSEEWKTKECRLLYAFGYFKVCNLCS